MMDDWILQSFCFCEMFAVFVKVKKADGDILRKFDTSKHRFMILEHSIGSAFRSMMTCSEIRGIILLHIHPRFLIWAPESKRST